MPAFSPPQRSSAAAALLAAIPLLAAGQARAAAIYGGGAAASAATIIAEQALFSAANPAVTFPSFPATTSTKVQTAIILNDPTQLGLAAGGVVDFGSSEQPLSASQTAQWLTVTTGKPVAGNLLQMPAFGVALAIPVVNGAVSANGQVVLSDNQLCGVFSGQITDWSQISSTLTPGTITVVYRPESAGTSFQLSQHLAAVCNAANSNFTLPITPSTVFSTLFPSAKLPVNFKPVSTLAGLALDMNTAETSAISYISPDWTSMAPNSAARMANGQRSNLLVAALTGKGSKALLPSLANISAALNAPDLSSAINSLPPSTAASAANALNWLPRLPTVLRGYPIVSYTAFVLPQCFTDHGKGAALRSFLLKHFYDPAYIAVQNANGQVQIAKTAAVPFLSAVIGNLLGNANRWNVNLQNGAACKGLAGR